MSEEEIYKNRDFMLGEIFENSKNTKTALEGLSKWCKDHDKADNKRFFWGGVAILVVAGAANVLPQVAAFALEHLK